MNQRRRGAAGGMSSQRSQLAISGKRFQQPKDPPQTFGNGAGTFRPVGYTESIHKDVLNRCMPMLVEDLDIMAAYPYLCQKEMLINFRLRDILEQTTTTEKVIELITSLRQRPYSYYKKFKEILELSKQSHLRKRLEEMEVTIIMETTKLDKKPSDKALDIQQAPRGSSQPFDSTKSSLRQDTVDPIQCERRPTPLSPHFQHFDIKQAQDKLIASYRRLRAVEVSVLLDKTCDIEAVYVDPVIQEKYVIKETEKITGENINRSCSKMMEGVTSFKQIFFGKGGSSMLHRIYLRGKGGFGKTTFCRKVLHTWCNVKKNMKDDKTSIFQDSEVLCMFEILFFINLREISDETSLTQVICSQCPLNSCPDESLISLFLDKHGDKVLLILDGLDELPRKATFMDDVVNCKQYPECCCFITSNPWKMYEMKLNIGPQIDLLLDLQGFSNANAIKCAKKILETCHDDVQATTDQFVKEIEENRFIKELMTVPLLHLILVQSWRECNRSLPKKLHEIYISLLDLLAERCKEKHKNDQDTWQLKPMQDDHIQSLPGKLYNMSLLKIFGVNFVASISSVAYHFMRMNNKENALVFDETQLLGILGNDGQNKLAIAQDICLISLIDPVSYTMKKKKLCFLHKTVQEFFTAVDLMLNPNKLEIFISSLTNLNDVLQSENTIVFLVGLSSQLGNKVLEKVCELCGIDKDIIQYREGYYVPSGRPENIMELYRRCMEEVEGSDVCLNVSDLSGTELDVHSLQPEHCKSLNLKIQISSSDVSLDLRALRNLRRIILRYWSDSKKCLSTSAPVMSVELNAPFLEVLYVKGPNCCVLEGTEMKTSTGVAIPLDQCLFDLSRINLTSCTLLKTLVLNNTDLQHFQLHLPNKNVLSELKLCKVALSSSACHQLGTDLTHCTCLNILHLEDTDLHGCMLDLSNMTVLSQLILTGLKLSKRCCNELGRTLKNCTSLRMLTLENIDLHDCQLDLSNMSLLSELKLMKVLVSRSGRKTLTSSLVKLESRHELDTIYRIATDIPQNDLYPVYVKMIYTFKKILTRRRIGSASTRWSTVPKVGQVYCTKVPQKP